MSGKKRKVRIGSMVLEGKVVYIESMVKVKTSLYGKALSEARSLQNHGAEIIRFAVKDTDDVKSLKKIKKQLKVPVIADIHFDHRLALRCLEFVDCARINPFNITSGKKIGEVAKSARSYRRCLRVGVNSGSVRKKMPLKTAFKERVGYAVKALEDAGVSDIMISAKSSSVEETVRVNKFLASKFNYPFHIGVTASGPGLFGVVKSCLGIGSLLLEGIGDTIRVSLTDTAAKEVLVSKYILQALGKRFFFAEVISCPTCGRAEKGFLQLARRASGAIERVVLDKPLKIAVMGCEVNGPGEAQEADLGFAFSQRWAAVFKKGKIVDRVRVNKFMERLEKEIKKGVSSWNART